MKLCYNLQKFKNALKRNFGKVHTIYYRGEIPSCARCFYLQTKKAYITFAPSSYFDSYVIYNMAKDCYSFSKIEDLLDADKKI